MASRLARAVPRFSTIVTRSFSAAASAEAQASHAPEASEELKLIFAAPDRAFFTDTVIKQVDVPTVAGVVGVLAKHVPTLGVLKPGVVQITDLDGNQTKMFVSSGTFSMNIDGTCQVLAEEAVPVEDIDESLARQELEAAQRRIQEGGSEVDKAEAAITIEVCEALIKAVHGQA
uniref:F-ATPase delta subunit n=1 Tax=Ascaris suum TaxID=6253 RepID=F1L371_ASCSU